MQRAPISKLGRTAELANLPAAASATLKQTQRADLNLKISRRSTDIELLRRCICLCYLHFGAFAGLKVAEEIFI